MATVQMPDGQLVELPDDPNDDEKEKIRQTLEAVKNPPQPQGGSPTPTPSPDEPIYQPSASPEAPRGGYFLAKAGVQPAQAQAPEGPAREVSRGLGDILRGLAPSDLQSAAEFATPVVGAVNDIVRGGQAVERAITGEPMADVGKEQFPEAYRYAGFGSKPLREQVSTVGGDVANVLMGLPIAGGLRPSLKLAFEPMFKRNEPISPTPLSDSATTEVTGNASEITSGTGVDLREQGTGVGEETSLRQQGPAPETSAPEAETTPVGGAAEQVAHPLQGKTYFRGEHPDQKGVDTFYSADRSTAEEYSAHGERPEAGAVREVQGESLPAKLYDSTNKEQLAEDLGIKGDTRGLDFDNQVKSKLQSQGYEGVRYSEGTSLGDEIQTPQEEIHVFGKPKEAKLLPGETQGDMLTSTQSEPLKLVGEQGVDHEARQLEAEAAAEEKATAEKGQTTFEDLAQTLTKDEEDALRKEYEQGLLEDVEQHQAQGGDELVDVLKSHGLPLIPEATHYVGELRNIRENFASTGSKTGRTGYGNITTGTGEKLGYQDIFRKGGGTLDSLLNVLRSKGFDVESVADVERLIGDRLRTGRKVFGQEARAEEGGVSGLEGFAMGAAGTKEIPARGWKDMLEAGERTPIETTDSLARAKGTIGKVLDTVAQGYRNMRDFITVDAIPKLSRAGLADAAYEHASARNSIVHSVRHILSRVFPDEYKNPAAMQRTGDILTKDNILGVYDQAQERLAQAEAGTPEYDAAADALSKIEESHNLASYDKDVREAMKDPKLARNIERWKTWVNPEMDRMYNEIKGVDPWEIQEPRGRHFGARINLLPMNQAADLARFADTSQPMPDIVTSNYRNPNIKQDPFMRRAAGTGQYSTDPGLILTNSLARRYNEVTKLRLYNAIEKTGNGFILDAGERPDATNLSGEDLTRMAIKMPETNPETGRTRPVEKSLWIKKSLARETRDVLNTDMAAPTNPVFKAITQLQLLQLTDATAHMKNIHTVVANSLGASKPWQDAVRKAPFLATADTVGRIAQVTREVAADTPAIRDEIAQMAKQGMIRPSYPSTGVQKFTKMQDAIHHVDTAARIVMNRFWDNLVDRGMVNDSMQARRAFVQQIGEYNGRLMGHFSRAMRNYGASPFVVAGRTFNAFSKRLITGDPGFKAATPQAAAAARAYQLSALTLATTVPAIINYATTGKFGGRPGTPIGAIDTGMNNDKGDKKIIDLFQLMGIRRGLRATGAGAVIEGVREGKSVNEVGGKAIDDITSTASHPWLGPALAATYSGLTGKRLDLRGGGWPYEAKRIKEGGLKQNAENLRVTLKNQNPMIYGLLAPLIGETEDTYGAGLMKGFVQRPLLAPFGYAEKPGDSAFAPTREKKSAGGVKVKP